MFNNASTRIQFSLKYTGNPNDITFGGQVAFQTQLSSTLVSLNCIGFMHYHKNDGNNYRYSCMVCYNKFVQTNMIYFEL